MTENFVTCKCGATIFEKIEANRYTNQSCMGRYIKPWVLLKCIRCGDLIKFDGHEDEELKDSIGYPVK